jgi:hypothetical protein
MRFLFSLLLVTAGALVFQGCDKNLSPLRSDSGAKLVLTVPKPPAPKDGISASFTLYALFKYRISSGGESVSGELDLNDIGNTGSINIPLPHNGKWLVAAEWIYNSDGTYPIYIGTDEADVQGTTVFTLNMGYLDTCYQGDMAELGSSYGNGDLFDLDYHVYGSSAVSTGIGQIQCLRDPDPTYPSLYFAADPGAVTPATFAYLGTGEWVDFTVVPTDAVFYADTLTAKKAALGATAYTSYGDTYAVKMSPTETAWIFVDQVSSYTPYTYIQFYYRTNHHGYPYMKFDVTHYGDLNCNNSGGSLY